MKPLMSWSLAAAALVFVVVSAVMNALFLSSLGRTRIEAGLLAAVSIAADMTKAALPVVLVRAAALRTWGQAAAAAVMLMSVTALSLASGTGFAALTREAASGIRAAHAERVVARRMEIQRIETRMGLSVTKRGSDVLGLEVAAAMLDRRWQASNGCAAPASPSSRAFCADVLKLKGTLAEARDRDRLEQELRSARAALDTLLAADIGSDNDPQATAIATLFGIERTWPRVMVASSVTIILELGSVLLVLLAAGSALRGAGCRGKTPSAPFVPAEVPHQADRSFWHRQRGEGEIPRARERRTGFDGRGT